ncbi:MAG: WG repeat-containing protein [Paludibacteraceae bacterium]|nr:WG repeat-containing protein [Paludibacteraceae bacterium]
MKRTFILKSLMVIALAIWSTACYAQRYYENVTWLVLAAEGRLDQPRHALLQLALFPIDANETEKVAMVRSRLQRARQEYDNMLEIRNSNSNLNESENTLAELRARLKEFESMPEIYAEMKKTIELAEAEMKKQKPMMESSHQNFTEDPKQLLKDVKEVVLCGQFFTGFEDIGNNRLMVTTEPRFYNAEYDVISGVESPNDYTFQYGVIDAAKGNIVIPIKYQYCGSKATYGSIYLVSKDEKGTHAGIMDYDGKVKKSFEYKDWHSVNNWCDIAVFWAPNNKLGFDHFDGHRVIEPQFDKVVEDTSDSDYAFDGFIGNEKYFISKTGKISK